jgi:hypothetical protein
MFDLLSGYKWDVLSGYAIRKEKIDGKRTIVSMHHLVSGRPESGYVSDHINGDRLDNRRENLRFCTLSQNSMNRGHRKNNKSGYKGVSYYKNNGKWRAYIRIKGKTKHLGYFTSIESAALAYNLGAATFFGEYSKINEVL